ncbi:MAG: hypothetical protein EZS28_042456, partial [Streblomastix strix]
MTNKESTCIETNTNESITTKHITLEKGVKRQSNRKTIPKSKSNEKATELMDKLIEEQELARIKREQEEYDTQKKEAEEQEFTKSQKEGEKKQVTGKLIDLTLVEDGDLCVIDFDINKKL